MLAWIREKFGRVITFSVIGFIAFVFIFYGVFNPKSTRGLHPGAVAGTVNGESISLSDFNRELNRKLEFFKKLTGNHWTDEQLRSFGIRQNVFQELCNRKLVFQELKRKQMLPSDEEVREQIQEISAFQKSGKFDRETYKKILGLNATSPSRFEALMREDLSFQKMQDFFSKNALVSYEEIKSAYMLSHDKRSLTYFLFTRESAGKKIFFQSSEIQDYLKDPVKLNWVKMKFEQGKGQIYQGKSFEDVKDSIVKSLLMNEKGAEIDKKNQELAHHLLTLWPSEKAMTAFLKPHSIVAKTTGLLPRSSASIPGLGGESSTLFSDAFSNPSPLDPKQGGKPRQYSIGGQVVVAWVSESQHSDLGHLHDEREALQSKLIATKSRYFYEQWLKKLTSKAKIEMNSAAIGVE